jgi:hypothetical protein
MTQEEKQIKLAEAAGWRLFSPFKNLWAPPKHVVEYECDAYPLPDCFNDLNAVHEFEKTLTDEEAYEAELIRVCQATPIWHATAAQRCEAIGLTLKLW